MSRYGSFFSNHLKQFALQLAKSVMFYFQDESIITSCCIFILTVHDSFIAIPGCFFYFIHFLVELLYRIIMPILSPVLRNSGTLEPCQALDFFLLQTGLQYGNSNAVIPQTLCSQAEQAYFFGYIPDGIVHSGFLIQSPPYM